MYLYFGQLSLSDVDYLAQQLWGRIESAATIRSEALAVITRLERWKERPLRRRYRYVFFQSAALHRRQSISANSPQIAVAVGIDDRGYREFLGITGGPVNEWTLWDRLMLDLLRRGLNAPLLVVGEMDSALRSALASHLPGIPRLASFSSFTADLLFRVKPSDHHEISLWIKRFGACVNPGVARALANELVLTLNRLGYVQWSRQWQASINEHLALFGFPRNHWHRLREMGQIRNELHRLREQLRILGSEWEQHRLVLLATAAFSHLSTGDWRTKPSFSFTE